MILILKWPRYVSIMSWEYSWASKTWMYACKKKIETKYGTSRIVKFNSTLHYSCASFREKKYVSITHHNRFFAKCLYKITSRYLHFILYKENCHVNMIGGDWILLYCALDDLAGWIHLLYSLSTWQPHLVVQPHKSNLVSWKGSTV